MSKSYKVEKLEMTLHFPFRYFLPFFFVLLVEWHTRCGTLIRLHRKISIFVSGESVDFWCFIVCSTWIRNPLCRHSRINVFVCWGVSCLWCDVFVYLCLCVFDLERAFATCISAFAWLCTCVCSWAHVCVWILHSFTFQFSWLVLKWAYLHLFCGKQMVLIHSTWTCEKARHTVCSCATATEWT